jgi:putative addiction module killer protein
MVEVRQTETFLTWVRQLTDRKAASIIAQRIARIQAGLLGDIKPVGGGVSELRVPFGPGYRLYLTQRGHTLVILLCGGDKSSQRRDIARAKALAADLED